MKVLAFDTSSKALSLAILEGQAGSCRDDD